MLWIYKGKKSIMFEELEDGCMKDTLRVVFLKDEYGFGRWSGGDSVDVEGK